MKRKFIIEIWRFKGQYRPNCALCGRKVEEGEEVVVIPTSSYYANYKGIMVYHLSCFLKEIIKKFKKYLKLTREGKELIIETNI